MAVVRYSDGARKYILDSVFNTGGGMFDSAVMDIYDGSMPAAANDAPTGTLLARITLPADAMAAAAAGGTISKTGTWQDTSADASGTAAWGRIREAGDAGGVSTTLRRMDFDITDTAGGGTATMDSTSIQSGGPVTVNSFVLTMPASA